MTTFAATARTATTADLISEWGVRWDLDLARLESEAERLRKEERDLCMYLRTWLDVDNPLQRGHAVDFIKGELHRVRSALRDVEAKIEGAILV